VPLDRADVDTDQIIPAEYLKRIERTGFGPFLFDEWRKDPAFVLNRPEHAGATILVTGPNFGSGSSREHAVWALEDHGFRAILAPSFADIFRNNCTKVGLLPVELPEAAVRTLLDAVAADPTVEIEVDLLARRVTAPGVDEAFEIDDFTRMRLVEGLDDIGLTLRHQAEIAAYERGRTARLPAVR
jgi:3-isopropylmalate/(R)-2-methylmalate dehydratase small subunit